MYKTISVAPMMKLTDRHYRALIRHLCPNLKLYTEMMVTGSVIHGDRDSLLDFNPIEHPVAIQLGGSIPSELAYCAKLAEQRGYDEINLNIGCPSDKVQSARFGACLMAYPELVAKCVAEIIETVKIPVTVKTRLGIDHSDDYQFLADFVDKVSETGCTTFIIHARKAWLKGLNPKQNRTVPPLQYDKVYRLKQDFPHLNIVINGGICTISEIVKHFTQVDGVMIGREAYRNPWFIKEIHDNFFSSIRPCKEKSREDIVRDYMIYIESQLRKGIQLRQMARHLLGMFHGQYGAKGWRIYLCKNGVKQGAGIDIIDNALKQVASA